MGSDKATFDNLREVSISTLNNSVTLRSTYPNEDLDNLINSAVAVLRHLSE